MSRTPSFNLSICIAAAGLAWLGLCPQAGAQENPGCASPQAFCASFLPKSCLERIGAGAVATDKDCSGDLANYKGCLEIVSRGCAEGSGGAPGAQQGSDAATVGSFQVALRGCAAQGTAITCRGTITNVTNQDQTLHLYGNASEAETSRAFSSEGEEFRPTAVRLGSSADTSCGNSCYISTKILPPAVPVAMELSFPSMTAGARRYALLEIGIYDHGERARLKARFRNVPTR